MYAAKYKRRAVLVLDGVDDLAKDNLPFFLRLQKFAKRSADDSR